MTSRAAMLAGLFASVMATASCGKSPNQIPATPAGPSSISDLLLPRLSGVWGGDLTLTAVAGGTGPARNAGGLGCVGAAFDEVIGATSAHTLSITQSGTDVTAKLVSAGTGLACTYKGTVGSGNTLVLHAEVCTQQPLTIRCQPHPETGVEEVHEMDLVGSSLTATFDAPVNVTQITGTAAHTYNVDDAALVANHTFTNFTRR